MKTHSIPRPSLRERHGVALVLFVLLVFVFMAIATVAIDVGRAFVTQQQMQVAVDTAALEGVRLRDADAYQDLSNTARRPRVSNLVRQVFDDDLHPTNTTAGMLGGPETPGDDPDALHIGAGPIFAIAGGSGPLNAQGTIQMPAMPFWDDPILQDNGGNAAGTVPPNEPYGDQISGTYFADVSHAEAPNYDRNDFRTGIGGTPEAFRTIGYLVRMRRSGTTNPLDNRPGTSMSGPTIPFLFGLGSLMLPTPGSTYNPRYDGLTVRATAIASGVPALRASPRPRDTDGNPIIAEGLIGPGPMLGLHPIVITYDYWIQTLTTGVWPHATPEDLEILPTGELRTTSGATVGRFASFATCVGQEIVPATPVAMPGGVWKSGYVAIQASIPAPNGSNHMRVVAYGFVDAFIVPSTGRLSLSAGIKSQQSSSTGSVTCWVAPNGASGRLDASAPALSVSEWQQVFAANRALAYPAGPAGTADFDYLHIRPGTLLAPVLVR